MARLRDQAIVIRLSDWSETSQVVTLLTREHGKVRGLAKGSKRASPSAVARFSGGFELLTAGEVLGNLKPHTDLAHLTEWDLQEPFRHLRQDLAAQHLGLYAADLCNALLADLAAHPGAYQSLADLLPALAASVDQELALLRFQWRLLQDCGYRPRLRADAITGEVLPVTATYGFDPQAGGVVRATPASDAETAQRGPWRVRRQTVEALRFVDEEGQTAVLPPPEPASLRRANRLLCVYLRTVIDRELPTMALLLQRD